MLDFGCLGLRPASALDLFLEVLIEDRDGLNLDVNSSGFKEGVNDVPQLRRNSFHTEAAVTKVLFSQSIDLCQSLVPRHELQRLLGGKNEIKALGEFLEEADILKAQVLIIEQIEEG